MMMVQYNESIVNRNLHQTDINNTRKYNINEKNIRKINKSTTTHSLQHKNTDGNAIEKLDDGGASGSSASGSRNHCTIVHDNIIVASLDVDFKSTLNLTAYKDNDNLDNTRTETIENIDRRRIVHSIFERLCSKYSSLCRCAKNLRNTFQRDSTKTLSKQFRRSLRLNKSAKSKGYEYFLSDEDKR